MSRYFSRMASRTGLVLPGQKKASGMVSSLRSAASITADSQAGNMMDVGNSIEIHEEKVIRQPPGANPGHDSTHITNNNNTTHHSVKEAGPAVTTEQRTVPLVGDESSDSTLHDKPAYIQQPDKAGLAASASKENIQEPINLEITDKRVDASLGVMNKDAALGALQEKDKNTSLQVETEPVGQVGKHSNKVSVVSEKVSNEKTNTVIKEIVTENTNERIEVLEPHVEQQATIEKSTEVVTTGSVPPVRNEILKQSVSSQVVKNYSAPSTPDNNIDIKIGKIELGIYQETPKPAGMGQSVIRKQNPVQQNNNLSRYYLRGI